MKLCLNSWRYGPRQDIAPVAEVRYGIELAGGFLQVVHQFVQEDRAVEGTVLDVERLVHVDAPLGVVEGFDATGAAAADFLLHFDYGYTLDLREDIRAGIPGHEPDRREQFDHQ